MASHISRRTSLTLTAGGMLSLLGACAPSTAPTATAPTAPPPTVVPAARTPAAGVAAKAPTSAPAAKPAPKDLVKLRLGLPTASVQNDSVAWYLLGKERGFQREQGVDVELVPIVSSTDIIRGVVSGDLQFGIAGANAIAATVASQKTPVKLFGTASDRLNFVFAARAPAKSLADLQGKTVGTGGFGSLTHVMILAAAEKLNVDPDKLEYANIGSTPDIYKALKAAKIDGGYVLTTAVPDIQTDSSISVIFDPNKVIPDFINQVFFAKADALQQRHDVFVRALAAMALGFRYAYDNREEAIALSAKTLAKSPADVEWGVDDSIQKQYINPNVDFTLEAMKSTQVWNIRIQTQPEEIPAEQFSTTAVFRDVLANIGRVQRRG